MLAHLLFCLLLAVLVSAAHCITLHIVVVSCCFNGAVNSTEHKFLLSDKIALNHQMTLQNINRVERVLLIVLL